MTTEGILNKITELSKEWYIVWSYGQKQKYRVEHFGYLYRDVEETFDTYKEAAEYLLNTLKSMMEREKSIEKSDE